MTKKADAWRDYQEAAMVAMLLETLPKVRAMFVHKSSFLKKLLALPTISAVKDNWQEFSELNLNL